MSSHVPASPVSIGVDFAPLVGCLGLRARVAVIPVARQRVRAALEVRAPRHSLCLAVLVRVEGPVVVVSVLRVRSGLLNFVVRSALSRGRGVYVCLLLFPAYIVEENELLCVYYLSILLYDTI